MTVGVLSNVKHCAHFSLSDSNHISCVTTEGKHAHATLEDRERGAQAEMHTDKDTDEDTSKEIDGESGIEMEKVSEVHLHFSMPVFGESSVPLYLMGRAFGASGKVPIAMSN